MKQRKSRLSNHLHGHIEVYLQKKQQCVGQQSTSVKSRGIFALIANNVSWPGGQSNSVCRNNPSGIVSEERRHCSLLHLKSTKYFYVLERSFSRF